MGVRKALLGLAMICAGASAQAADGGFDGRIGTGLECVPYARQMSGVAIHGNAWTWWDAAKADYQEGTTPRFGAVLVFKPHGPMALGHVAVVSKIVSARILMVSHANWSRIGGVRGQIERDVTLVDVSPANDWSQVRVWWHDGQGLGTTSYPVYGFIYAPHPNAELASASPDVVGAVIDSLVALPSGAARGPRLAEQTASPYRHLEARRRHETEAERRPHIGGDERNLSFAELDAGGVTQQQADQ